MPKPSIPQGTRDFGAETVRKRNYIFSTIREVFELYGFQPLETPAMENLETLMGKYGEEGDKLIFKILNNGLDNPSKRQKANEDFEKVLEGKNSTGITERALRYDLTIPFARYVAMNHNQLTLPFKRYQMQPVWRADRPQKGRYREFYQCDADVVGSHSLLSDTEFAIIYAEVFKRLKIDVEIKINNRKILTALAEICGSINKLTEITVAIDKLDKMGINKVKEELSEKGMTNEQIGIIETYLAIEGSNVEKLNKVAGLVGNNETGRKGIEELRYALFASGLSSLTVDLALARGLNYYTGTIFEAKAKNVAIGSIGGGGRYNDLTGLFGVPNIPGIGISFGVDRIYDVMEELKLFPKNIYIGTKVLFFNLGEQESKIAFLLMQGLRANGVASELYHEHAKFDKQFKYADKKNIPFAVIIGSKELEEKLCIVKDLKTGEQISIMQDELINAQWLKG
ncbi:MAG: histidine--tRNA ligase [Bacteroidetes bacterium]|nr:histidine--tRNA ligase [Bacteroidota bacterium]MBS1974456.1 histidine--tRNA ligase [Bacteroidota bacterium]